MAISFFKPRKSFWNLVITTTPRENELKKRIESLMCDRLPAWIAATATRCAKDNKQRIVSCRLRITDLESDRIEIDNASFNFEELGL